MTRAFYIVDDEVPVTKKRNRRQGEKVIKDVKEVQRVFWNID
jgi:hypothetical protein